MPLCSHQTHQSHCDSHVDKLVQRLICPRQVVKIVPVPCLFGCLLIARPRWCLTACTTSCLPTYAESYMSSLKGVCSQSRLAEFTGASLSVITTGVVPTASHRYVLYPYVQRGPSVNAILHGIATPAAIRHRFELSPRRQCRRAVRS